jgi:hypothetical protein
MAQCTAIKADGERCRGIAKAGSNWCPAHDPARRAARRLIASHAARSKGGDELRALKERVRELYRTIQAGEVDPKSGAVLTQIANTEARIVDLEHRHRYDKRLLISREQMAEEIGTLMNIIRRHVRDRETLEAISDEMEAVIEKVENV